MRNKNYKNLAKLERSIPIIDGKKILFNGQKTKKYSLLTDKEKDILKSKLSEIIEN